jgi:ketosteroid isomerase-like protein
MADAEQNKDIIRRGYEAFSAGDIETVMSLFDDNVEWVQPGQSALSGTYHGKGELGAYLAKLAEKPLQVRLERMVAEGDVVVALTDMSIGDEKGHDADVFTLRDGKTVRVEVHGDTALMERVYGKKEMSAH